MIFFYFVYNSVSVPIFLSRKFKCAGDVNSYKKYKCAIYRFLYSYEVKEILFLKQYFQKKNIFKVFFKYGCFIDVPPFCQNRR
jgi:hypothetical protein